MMCALLAKAAGEMDVKAARPAAMPDPSRAVDRRPRNRTSKEREKTHTE